MTASKIIKWASVGVLMCIGLPRLQAVDDPLAKRVIIVANSNQPESIKLAEFYAEKRGIPRLNIISLPLPETESITWREFIDVLYRPLQEKLYRGGWLDGTTSKLGDRLGRARYALTGHHVSYLVTCRGVPLKINNDSSLLDEPTGLKIGRLLFKDEAAVDSELSMLAQSGYEITGYSPNPFFGKDLVSALDAGTVIKVSRLDGPTFEDARNLVTSALEGERIGLIGRYYVDLRGPHPDGDKWLEGNKRIFETLAFDGEVENTEATFDPAARFDAPALYFGWYRNDFGGPFAVEGFKFPPGAIALHIHSYSARTLHSTTQGWCGPLVAHGVAATVGNVFEPYLQLTHRPDLLLLALSQGKNFGDAVYYALPALSWQDVAIGDPLYRPFKVSLEQQERLVDQLSAESQAYLLTRRANTLLRAGKTQEAWTLLRSNLQAKPGLVLAVACGRLALAGGSVPAAVDALSTVKSLGELRVDEWPLAREVAGILAANGARPAALLIYAQLTKAKAPTAAAHKALLTEAHAVAQAAGDRALTEEFASQLSDTAQPLITK